MLWLRPAPPLLVPAMVVGELAASRAAAASAASLNLRAEAGSLGHGRDVELVFLFLTFHLIISSWGWVPRNMHHRTRPL